jgi:NADH-quinone oxidoreductase subunit E
MTATCNRVLSLHDGAGRDALIPILQDIQSSEGFLSKEDMVLVAHHLGISAAKVYGVASFYNQFRFRKPGLFKIQLCRGTACHVKGSSPLLDALERELAIKAGQTTQDGLFSIEVVACIGACGLAPVVAVNGEFHGGVTTDRLPRILKECRQEANAMLAKAVPT